MAIKAIIFDCFGVLITQVSSAFMNNFPDKAEELRDLALRADYGYLTTDEYNQQAAELTGLSVEEYTKKYWERVRDQAAFDWLADLKNNKLKIGLLSNISATGIDKFIPKPEREQLFDAVVLSGEVGITKPAPEIFEIMSERLGLEASECVMVDDLLENVQGAERTGMKAILYGSAVQAKADFKALLEADNA